MTPQEMIDIIQAYKDGKQIEAKYGAISPWIPTDKPSWNFDGIEYRIAPKQTKELYKFLIHDSKFNLYYESYYYYTNSEEAAKALHLPQQKVYKRLDYTKITIEE